MLSITNEQKSHFESIEPLSYSTCCFNYASKNHGERNSINCKTEVLVVGQVNSHQQVVSICDWTNILIVR